MEQEEFQKLKAENTQLAQQLTKRSEEYIFKLKKAVDGQVTVEVWEEALNDILKQLIAGQKKGETATQLFGQVHEMAAKIIAGPKQKPTKLKPWQMWLDNFLILFMVLDVVSALMGLISPEQNQSVMSMLRITSLTLSSAIGGLVFYYFNKLIYQYDLPGADKSKKPSFGKQMLIMGGGIIIWIFAMQAVMFIPGQINPTLSPVVILILAGIAYLVRWYMKKTLGYKSSMMSFVQTPEDK